MILRAAQVPATTLPSQRNPVTDFHRSAALTQNQENKVAAGTLQKAPALACSTVRPLLRDSTGSLPFRDWIFCDRLGVRAATGINFANRVAFLPLGAQCSGLSSRKLALAFWGFQKGAQSCRRSGVLSLVVRGFCLEFSRTKALTGRRQRMAK